MHPFSRSRLWWLSIYLMLIAGCASVPLDQPRQASVAIDNNAHTQFGALAAGWAGVHGNKSGFFPFQYGSDALGARLDMAERAQASIDLQYFLMKDDKAGRLMSTALLRAADRGVRVRFLLDDVFTTAPDGRLVQLSQHPNIEVRLFNPISRRGLRGINFVSQFRRANRRMHNKSFTVDNAITIVGGRNIADEYFQLKEDAVFSDFDILGFGPIARDVSASFDSYWNHRLAIPIEGLSGARAAPPLRDSEGTSEYERAYEKAISSELLQDVISGARPLYPATALVLADDPEKLQRKVNLENQGMTTELGEILLQAQTEVQFVTPYYVPLDSGIEFARRLVDQGVRVVVATNSLAANNHTAVHSAYAGYRHDVVKLGVELYEVRANAGKVGRETLGSPDALTLHTKLIVIDRRFLFIGSLNLDPRSIEINAEMGLLIDAPELASAIAEGLDRDLPIVAYQVSENERGRLAWRTSIDGQEIVENREPLASRWRRLKAFFLRVIPDRQL